MCNDNFYEIRGLFTVGNKDISFWRAFPVHRTIHLLWVNYYLWSLDMKNDHTLYLMCPFYKIYERKWKQNFFSLSNCWWIEINEPRIFPRNVKDIKMKYYYYKNRKLRVSIKIIFLYKNSKNLFSVIILIQKSKFVYLIWWR